MNFSTKNKFNLVRFSKVGISLCSIIFSGFFEAQAYNFESNSSASDNHPNIICFYLVLPSKTCATPTFAFKDTFSSTLRPKLASINATTVDPMTGDGYCSRRVSGGQSNSVIFEQAQLHPILHGGQTAPSPKASTCKYEPEIEHKVVKRLTKEVTFGNGLELAGNWWKWIHYVPTPEEVVTWESSPQVNNLILNKCIELVPGSVPIENGGFCSSKPFMDVQIYFSEP